MVYKAKCLKCKEQREMKDVVVVLMPNGRSYALNGRCSVCGTNMYVMTSKANAEAALAAGLKLVKKEKKGGDDEPAVDGGAQKRKRKRKSKKGGCDCGAK